MHSISVTISTILVVIGTLFVLADGECEDYVTVVFGLDPGSDPNELARSFGFLKYVGPVGDLPGVHEFAIACRDGRDAADVEDEVKSAMVRVRARGAAENGGRNDGAGRTQQQRISWDFGVQAKKSLHPRGAPTAPHAAISPPVAQWHLADAGNEATGHVSGAWSFGSLGSGSTISIVDDGLAWRHQDLRRGFVGDISADYNGARGRRSSDPSPAVGDTHGTSAAGVAAAGCSGSPRCGFGVAPMSRLAGVRLTAGPVADSTEARGLSHCSRNVTVYSCSWGPQDDGRQLDGPGPLASAAITDSAQRTGRGGMGSVYVWAAGNGRRRGDSCAYDGYVGHPDVVPVAAVSRSGRFAEYSESCGAVMLSAPSSGDGWAISTTGGDGGGSRDSCVSDFGGTSAAAPFVAGVVALVSAANPGLGSRDIVRLLVSTARRIDAGDASWRVNAAGVWHSQSYGFGVVDAAAAVAAAPGFVSIPSAMYSKHGFVASRGLPARIPDDQRTWSETVCINASTPEGFRTENVELTISALHPSRGDLSIEVVSPGGTTAVVPSRPTDSSPNYSGWKFRFVNFWGERGHGLWCARAIDTVRGPRGKPDGAITGVAITVHGRCGSMM